MFLTAAPQVIADDGFAYTCSSVTLQDYYEDPDQGINFHFFLRANCLDLNGGFTALVCRWAHVSVIMVSLLADKSSLPLVFCTEILIIEHSGGFSNLATTVSSSQIPMDFQTPEIQCGCLDVNGNTDNTVTELNYCLGNNNSHLSCNGFTY
ncbi:hypothetical protein BDZ45DRAFT_730627 [Acephala macrosclerotiorum]|nr:hypothetical protein BDZ45DRAFT_730627 [Acephala macrosclerotiorum]